MSDPSSLRQYAKAYRQLAAAHASPELRALLIRMAEVWDALAIHTNRIAAERAAAEDMPDAPLAPDPGERGWRVRSPEHEYND